MIWRIVFIYFIFIFYTRYREKCVSLLVGCEWCCSCFTRTHSHTLALQYKDRNTAAVFIRNSLSNPSHVAKKKKKNSPRKKTETKKTKKNTWSMEVLICVMFDPWCKNDFNHVRLFVYITPPTFCRNVVTSCPRRRV